MPDAESVAVAVTRQLRDDGFTVEVATIAGVPAHVARRAVFRWSWLATRLHVFVVALDRTVADVANAQRLAESAVEYALANKTGLPRGFQTGVVSVAVLATDGIEPDLRAWARKGPRPRFAAFSLPVVLDLETGESVVPLQRGFRGIVYASFLQRLVDRVAAAAQI